MMNQKMTKKAAKAAFLSAALEAAKASYNSRVNAVLAKAEGLGFSVETTGDVRRVTVAGVTFAFSPVFSTERNLQVFDLNCALNA